MAFSMRGLMYLKRTSSFGYASIGGYVASSPLRTCSRVKLERARVEQRAGQRVAAYLGADGSMSVVVHGWLERDVYAQSENNFDAQL